MVFWQTQNTIVENCYTENNTFNGIAGGGLRDFWLIGCRHFQDGWSTIIDGNRWTADRAGFQIREILPSFTSANLSMPAIAPDPTYAMVNKNVNIINCTGENCAVMSWMFRSVYPGSMLGCYSKNAGFHRLDANTYNPAHFWIESSWFNVADCTCEQTIDNSANSDTVPDPAHPGQFLTLPWLKPVAMMAGSFDGIRGQAPNVQGAPHNWDISGTFPSTVSNFRASCGLGPVGVEAQQFFFGKGIIGSEWVTVDGATIEGTSDYPMQFINAANFNLFPVRHVTVKNVRIRGCMCTAAIAFSNYTSFNETTGDAEDIVIDGLEVRELTRLIVDQVNDPDKTDWFMMIHFDVTMDGVAIPRFRAVNLNLDGTDINNHWNGVRLRKCDTSRDLEIHFANARNLRNPVSTNGFHSLKVTGNIDTCYRVALFTWGFVRPDPDPPLDYLTSDPERFYCKVVARNLSTDIFGLLVPGTHKFGNFVAEGCEFHGSTTLQTWQASAKITVLADQFFKEATRFVWKDNFEDYGTVSGFQDMRRLFSTTTTMNAATPFYLGEQVIVAADSSVWMGTSIRTAGKWFKIST
jgi:hypothetical protein